MAATKIPGELIQAGAINATSISDSSITPDKLHTSVAQEGLHSNSSGIRVLANNGLLSNSSGTFVVSGDGVASNATGVHVVAGNNQLVSNSTGIFVTESNLDIHNLSGYVANENIDHSSVTLTAGNGITGGGDITASRSFAVVGGTGVTSNATGIHIGQDVSTTSDVTFANVTQTASIIGTHAITSNTTHILVGSTKIDAVDTAIANLVASAPGTLDTLNEIATALGSDPDLANTLTTSIATKAPSANPTFTGNATFDTSTLFIDGTNNRIGIGTTSPSGSHKLTVESSIRLSGAAPAISYVETDASNQEFITGMYSGVFSIRDVTNATYPVQINPAAPTSTLYLAANGNIGIRTSSPVTGLQVAGQHISIDNGLAYQSFTNAGTRRNLLGVNSSDTITIGDTNFGKITILSSGNVGIGNTNPQGRLTISGPNSPSQPVLDITATGSGAFQRGVMMLNSGMSSGDSILYCLGRSDNSYNMGQTYFYFNGAGSTSNRISMGLHSVDDVFNILGTGNIGINTTNPLAQLHVVSTANVIYQDTLVANTGQSDSMVGMKLSTTHNNNNHIGVWFATGSSNGTHWSGITGNRSNYASNWGTHLSFYTHKNTQANLNEATERVRVQADGTLLHKDAGQIHTLRTQWSQGLGSLTAVDMSEDTNFQFAHGGFEDLGVLSLRGFGQYVDIKTNYTADNLMFMFKFTGYLYNRGNSLFYGGGYTYNSTVISKDIGSGNAITGPCYVYELYRASDGALCAKIYGATTSYDEGKVHVGLFTFGAQPDIRIVAARVTNSTTNYY